MSKRRSDQRCLAYLEAMYSIQQHHGFSLEFAACYPFNQTSKSYPEVPREPQC
ncbi:hypothetical protein QIS74_13548 [Colletotrichum tabaci]|uniref:Uncharacterized protein n=1 Tax=Colletotrichum tabaci TaxID=1209068 RepID=A0AAV9SVB2_9PEZI